MTNQMILLAFLASAVLGAAAAHWAWCHTIYDKAKNGFRLEMGGQLYRILREDNSVLDQDVDALSNNMRAWVLQKLASDPRTRQGLQRLLKTLNPELSIPEIDVLYQGTAEDSSLLPAGGSRKSLDTGSK